MLICRASLGLLPDLVVIDQNTLHSNVFLPVRSEMILPVKESVKGSPERNIRS